MFTAGSGGTRNSDEVMFFEQVPMLGREVRVVRFCIAPVFARKVIDAFFEPALVFASAANAVFF